MLRARHFIRRANGQVRRLSTKIDKKEEKPVSLFLGKEDSTSTRIMGSDWADRRGQPLTFSMKVYWTIFGLFIVNGVYAQYTGNGEFELYHKARATIVGLLFGSNQTNEHAAIAEAEEKKNAVENVQLESNEQNDQAETSTHSNQPTTTESAIPSGPVAAQKSTPNPYFTALSRTGPPRPRPVLTKEQLLTELDALREQERQDRIELKGGSIRDLDTIEAEIREIEYFKAELKRRIKLLK